MTNREKGVATAPCPSCSTDLKKVTMPDGGVTTEPCPKCGPKSEKAAKAAPASVSRETGTDIKEESA